MKEESCPRPSPQLILGHVDDDLGTQKVFSCYYSLMMPGDPRDWTRQSFCDLYGIYNYLFNSLLVTARISQMDYLDSHKIFNCQ